MSTETLELITANVSAKPRRVTLHNRDFLVVPLSLLPPGGVLNGSRGPLYYPPDEISKDPESWNAMPIVVYHPRDHAGNPVSARSPEVLEKQGIGYVFNARYGNGLKAEGWFDVANTERYDAKLPTDKRILPRLVKGQEIELSTGLFTKNEPAPAGAVFNGVDRSGRSYSRPYTHVARNHKPDHLAVLPDQVGACSIKDGCGVLVNEDGTIRTLDHTTLNDQIDALATAGPPRINWKRLARVAGLVRNGRTPNGDTPIGTMVRGYGTIAGIPAAKACQAFTDGTIDGQPLTQQQWLMLEKLCGVKPVRPIGGNNNIPGRGDDGGGYGDSLNNDPTLGPDGTVVNVSKTVGGKSYTAKDFAYVPDPNKPATWKLLITDAEHVGGAIAALGKGFRGQKVSIPTAALAAVKRKVRAAWKRFNKDKAASEMPEVIRNEEYDGWDVNNADLSYDELSRCVAVAFRDTHPSKYDTDTGEILNPCYLVSIYDGYVIYSEGGDLYRQDYEMADDGTCTFTDEDPQPVQRVVQYVPTGNDEPSTTPTSNCGGCNTACTCTATPTGDPAVALKLTEAQKKQIKDNLAANANCQLGHHWKDLDLNALSDDALVAYDKLRVQAITLEGGLVNPDGSRQVFDMKSGRWNYVPAPVQNQGGQQGQQGQGNQNQGQTQTGTPMPQTQQAPQGGYQPVQNGQQPITPPLVPGQTPLPPVNRPRSLTEALEAFGTPEEKAAWNSVVLAQQQQKAALLERLTGNMDQTTKQAAWQIYDRMDVPQLQLLANALPQQHDQHQPVANYFGAAGGPVTPSIVTNEEPLTSPVYDYSRPV